MRQWTAACPYQQETEIKKALKAKWVAALRSGKFKQYRDGALASEDGTRHCCLGVLSEISPAVNSRGTLGDAGQYLSHDALEYAGFDNVVQDKLSCMNDREGSNKKTFKGIATWIEKHL